MTRVLIIRDKTMSFNGGIKRHCNELRELVNQYKEIEVLPIEDIPCKYVKLAHKFKYDTKSLRQHIIDSKCEIVHVHGFMSIGCIQAINMAYKLKKKIIYSPHFHPFQYLQNPFLGKLFFHCMIKPILHKVNTIITINKEDTAFFQQYHPDVTCIPHWITQPQSIQNTHPCKTKNMLLFIGRNDANKGLEHLYQLPPIYQVHCVTKGPLLRKDFILHESISDSELNDLYKQANAVVIPSRYEAFSLVALEALSNHTPVVISDRVRIGDYLQGNKGYQIFKYHDFTAFNKAVETIVAQKDIDFETLLKPFKKSAIQEKYYQTYTKIDL